MNLIKKILLVHADPRQRRRLVMTLAAAGYDLRAFPAAPAALACARTEWFDLALVDSTLPGTAGFAFVEELKTVQPTLPRVMLVPELDLPLVVRGIRLGLTDVLLDDEDLAPLIRRIHALLRPDQVTGADEELTPADLAAVEKALARVEPEATRPCAVALDPSLQNLREELLTAARARATLETQLERAQHEKHALAAELRTLLAQNADQAKLQDELDLLHSQREMAAATQNAIDEKARLLTNTRAAIAAERAALAAERNDAASTPPFPATPATPAVAPTSRPDHDVDLEWARLDAIREDLREEEDKVRQEASRVRHEATQLAQERRRWHDDLDLLSAREENLRAYEERLRRLQAQLEAGQLSWHAQQPSPAPTAATPFQHDSSVRAAWEKLQRANELLEAERAMFRDERMALQDLQQTIHRREDELRDLEARLAQSDARLRNLPPLPPSATRPPSHSADPAGKNEPRSALKSFTRAPFSIWSRGKSESK